jgi:hypothetical protein
VTSFVICCSYLGHAVVYLVEALCYKLEGRGFESPWGEFFSIYQILSVTQWPWGQLSLQQKWVPGIFLGGKGWPVCKADNLTAICKPIV